MNSPILNMAAALAMFIISCSTKNNDLSIWLMGCGTFISIYTIIMSIRTKESDIFAPVKMPPPQVARKEVTVKHTHEHRHHNYNYTQCTEGVEISKTLPNGTTVNVRHVKKWQ